MEAAPPSSPPSVAAPPRALSLLIRVVIVVALLGGAVFSAALLAFVAPGAVLPLFVRPLPGFELSFPPGQRTEMAAGNYRVGRVVVQVPPRRFYVEAHWEAGGLLEPDEQATDAEAHVARFGASRADVQHDVQVAVPGRLPSQSWTITIPGKGQIWNTRIACGARRVTIITAGWRPTIERLHRRVTATFVCHSDAARDARIADIPVALGWPGGWRPTKRGADRLEATNGKYTVIVRTVSGKLTEEMVDRAAPAFAARHVRLGAREGSEWPIQERGIDGWFGLRYCPDRDQTLTVVANPSSPTADTATAQWVLRYVRCRREGEPPAEWLSAP